MILVTLTPQFPIDRPFISFADMASSIYDHKIFDATADSTAIEFTVVSAPNNCIQREMPYEIYTFAMWNLQSHYEQNVTIFWKIYTEIMCTVILTSYHIMSSNH